MEEPRLIKSLGLRASHVVTLKPDDESAKRIVLNGVKVDGVEVGVVEQCHL